MMLVRATHYRGKNMGTPKTRPRAMRVAEVAEAFNLSEDSIYRYARSGVLKNVRIGRSLRFLREDIEAFILRGGTGRGDS